MPAVEIFCFFCIEWKNVGKMLSNFNFSLTWCHAKTTTFSRNVFSLVLFDERPELCVKMVFNIFIKASVPSVAFISQLCSGLCAAIPSWHYEPQAMLSHMCVCMYRWTQAYASVLPSPHSAFVWLIGRKIVEERWHLHLWSGRPLLHFFMFSFHLCDVLYSTCSQFWDLPTKEVRFLVQAWTRGLCTAPKWMICLCP